VPVGDKQPIVSSPHIRQAAGQSALDNTLESMGFAVKMSAITVRKALRSSSPCKSLNTLAYWRRHLVQGDNARLPPGAPFSAWFPGRVFETVQSIAVVYELRLCKALPSKVVVVWEVRPGSRFPPSL
jgi:hypothetical protein